MFNDIYIDGKDNLKSVFLKLTAEPTGYTIARTAKILDMSKQAVDQAIRRDALYATRIYMATSTDKYTLVSTEVDRDSVIAYARARDGRDRVPYGFKTDQRELFS